MPECVVKIDYGPRTGTAADTGIVHQDVDRAERLKDLLDYSRRGRGIRKIRWYGDGFAAALPNLVHQRFEIGRAPRRDRHRRAFARITARDGTTDTAASPRN
jgi:hypothetical protein